MSATNSAGLLVDSFGRIREAVHEAVDGLTEDELAARVDPDANSIAWLVWHLTRIQDDHLAGAFGTDQLWDADGWRDRFGLPFGKGATGYGQTSAQAGKVRAPADLLLGYHDAVHARTLDLVRSVTNADLDRVVDAAWDPPVTLGVRLVSVIADDLQHAGQAAYVRGVVERR
ncbi:putative damage-inducible protein DinB [Streptomyces sp. PvR006]|uniref:mycothiol transferase n=1 Tax=unclassified Streptomyces TaxID=2593676 RepID=UPI001AEA7C6A|nr:DinB family protein [Streptomyces sp. PvR006]MBP2583977.1 putative damage-inducible protein DinB [Streptomyces sp. PvR006]